MKIIHKVLEPDHDIILAGDFHRGTPLCHKKAIEDMLHMLSISDNTYLCGMGDFIEAITTNDPRFDLETTDVRSTPDLQMKEVQELIRPVRDKVLVAMDGNHELKLARVGKFVKRMCETLDIEYGTYTAKIHIHSPDGKLMYKMYLTHGFKRLYSTADDPIRREANMKLQLKRLLMEKAGDCHLMAMGHCHKLLVAKPTRRLYMTDNGEDMKAHYTGIEQDKTGDDDYIHPDHRWYAATGSFLKLFGDGISGYAEVAGYDPHELGYVKIRCVGGEIHHVEEVVI
jgi:hypothetical protein